MPISQSTANSHFTGPLNEPSIKYLPTVVHQKAMHSLLPNCWWTGNTHWHTHTPTY